MVFNEAFRNLGAQGLEVHIRVLPKTYLVLSMSCLHCVRLVDLRGHSVSCRG